MYNRLHWPRIPQRVDPLLMHLWRCGIAGECAPAPVECAPAPVVCLVVCQCRVERQFAVDERKLFGSDALAAKGAGLELQALNELVATEVPGLHFALMATIDYAGRRMSVSSVLPIGKDTLCYGRYVVPCCATGGVVVENSSLFCLCLQR